jgi:4-hydroxy-tetrahydrodipicolinate reductase
MAKKTSPPAPKASVSKRIPVAVFGAGGRMGVKNMGMILQQDDMDLMAALERPEHAFFGQDAGAVSGTDPIGVLLGAGLEQALRGAKVMVDFSSPKGTMSHLNASIKNGVALVIGTTGLSKPEIAKIHSAAKKIPVVFSGNFSLGVNVLLGLARQAATLLDGYDAELVEYHHNQKKDAPSGTALMLARQVAAGKNLSLEKHLICGRQGQIGARKKDEIGIHAVRGGGIIGRHEVLLVSDHETITLGHLAHGREAFTTGVMKAVRFAARAPAGMYSMLDVLGMK